MSEMNIFCNVDKSGLSKGKYFLLPVTVLEIQSETAAVPENYFSNLIVKILEIGDKSLD